MEHFSFTLTDEEKRYLKDLVRASILEELDSREPEAAADLSPRPDVPPEPPTAKLKEQYGAFVTLQKSGQLRGCIGHIVGDRPLADTIRTMAMSAAFQDPRFPPLSAAEYPLLEVEISVLSPLTECPDPQQIEVGRHGLLVRRGSAQGLLLPQVATEWKWDREMFLQQTCRKAGLPADAWRDPKTTIYWFEAEIF